MALNYTITETKRDNLHDGDYTAIVKGIEEKMDKYGSFIQIEEEIVDPAAHYGRIEYERFYIGAYDQTKKERAVYQFSRFCKQLSGLETGDVLTDDDLIGKKFILTIKNNIGNDGKIYQNTVNRVLIPSTTEETIQYGGLSIPQEPVQSNKPLNDEVPF